MALKEIAAQPFPLEAKAYKPSAILQVFVSTKSKSTIGPAQLFSEVQTSHLALYQVRFRLTLQAVPKAQQELLPVLPELLAVAVTLTKPAVLSLAQPAGLFALELSLRLKEATEFMVL